MTATLELRNIVKDFYPAGSFLGSLVGRKLKPLRAVDHVTLDVLPGEIVGVIGQSGSGKSTLGRIAVKLIEPTEGVVSIDGTDISDLTGSALRRARSRFQIIFQDPYRSLNPRKSVGWLLEEPLRIHEPAMNQQERAERVRDALERVGLSPPAEFRERYPGQLSGGQRQRVAVGRAIILRPRLLVADEPVSMLDVSVRAGILTLLRDLTDELGMSQMFITHDLAVAKQVCDRLAVMQQGQVVELGQAVDVLTHPNHEYTRKLITALPELPR